MLSLFCKKDQDLYTIMIEDGVIHEKEINNSYYVRHIITGVHSIWKQYIHDQ